MDVCCHCHRILLLHCLPSNSRVESKYKTELPPVNSIVDQDHTGHGQPESEKRGEDGVGDVWVEDTFRNAAHLFNVRLPGPGRCNADKSPK